MTTLKNFSFKKKGNVGDIALWIVVTVMLMFLVVFGYRIWNGINDELQSNDIISTEAKAVSQELTNDMPTFWDSGFLLLVVLIYIAILVFVWFIDIHPVFLALTLISSILLIVVGGIMNNITERMLKESPLATTSVNFPIMVFFAEHFGLIVFFLVMGALIVMFAKWRSTTE